MSTDQRNRTEALAAGCASRTELWYLGFLLILLFQPMFDPASGLLAWVSSTAAAAIFVPFSLYVGRRPGRLRRWSPALSATLGLVLFPINSGALVFLIYAAAFAAAHTPRTHAFRWFAGLSATIAVLALFTPMPFPFALVSFAMPALFVWIVGVSALEEGNRARASEQLRIENTRIEHLATAAERERIARDLHDLIGQSLTEVIVRAQLVRRLIDADPTRAAAEAEEIERSSRRALGEVRATVRGWREVRIDDELEVVERALDAAGIGLRISRDPDFDPPPTTETALALALREAVTNVIRHADASSCTVALRHEDGWDVLEVADDGRVAAVTEGSGLAGLRERILALGGQVEWSTESGMTVTARVPGLRSASGASAGSQAGEGGLRSASGASAGSRAGEGGLRSASGASAGPRNLPT